MGILYTNRGCKCHCFRYPFLYQSDITSWNCSITKESFDITQKLSCFSRNVVYEIHCTICKQQYIGKVGEGIKGLRTYRTRSNEHISGIKRLWNLLKKHGFYDNNNKIIGDLRLRNDILNNIKIQSSKPQSDNKNNKNINNNIDDVNNINDNDDDHNNNDDTHIINIEDGDNDKNEYHNRIRDHLVDINNINYIHSLFGWTGDISHFLGVDGSNCYLQNRWVLH